VVGTGETLCRCC